MRSDHKERRHDVYEARRLRLRGMIPYGVSMTYASAPPDIRREWYKVVRSDYRASGYADAEFYTMMGSMPRPTPKAVPTPFLTVTL